MRKKDTLKDLRIDFVSSGTIFIRNRILNFSYTQVRPGTFDILGRPARYMGGLQCPYEEGSPDYKILEEWLCEIAEWNLKFTKQ